MKIFLKYVLKSMTEKKGRFILLIASIALSTGLLIASIGTVNVALDAIIKPVVESMEKKEIDIVPEDAEAFFDGKDINEKGIKNIVKEIWINGSYNSKDEDLSLTSSIHGRNKEDLSSYTFIEGSLGDFNENECVISKRTSDKENLSCGDTIEIVIAGEKQELKIVAISDDEGIFYSDNSTSFTVAVPYVFVSDLLNVSGKYNLIIANKDLDSTEESIDLFNDNNETYRADKLINEDALKSQTASFSQTFYYMLIIVVLMSSIIIYSSFKLIILERISVIGTFLSQGARKRTVERILYMESIFYGVIGSAFGCIIGVLGLNLVGRMISPLKEYGIYEKIDISPMYIISGVIFAIILSFISAIIPIKRIRKLEVKEIILNTINESEEIGWKKFIIGALILGLCTILSFSKSEMVKKASILFILLVFVGVIMIYPKVVDIVTSIIYKMFRGRSKSMLLALNNIRTSKVLLGNITLILISIMAVFMITSLGSSIETCVTDVYKKIDYDIEVSGISTIKNTDTPSSSEIIDKVENTEGFKEGSTTPIFMTSGDINDSKSNIRIFAVDPQSFKKSYTYLELDEEPNKSVYSSLLDDKEGVIVSSLVSKKNNVQKGDTIKLTISDIEREVEVIDIIDAKLLYNGYMIFTTDRYLSEKYDFKGYNYLMFKTDIEPDEFKDKIKYLNKDYGVSIATRDENIEENNAQNRMIIDILNIFSYMAMIIAALGVINNISIGFIQRKRSLAVLSSVGMSKGNRNKMLIFESLFTVIWAVLFSIPGTMILVRFLTMVLANMDFAIKVSVDYKVLPTYFISAVVIILIATIPVIFKSRKLSVVNELKYE